MSSSVAHDPGISTVSTWLRGARSAALQSSRRETALAAGAVSLLCAVLVYLTWHRWGGIDTDSGYDIAAGTRVAHGQLPYADFVYYYGPLAPMLAGLAVWIGGSGMAAAAVLGFCVGAAILSSVFILSHRLAGPFGAFVATSLTAAIGFSASEFGFVLPYTFADPLGLLCVLLMFLAIGRFLRTDRRIYLALGGVALGCAGLTKPEFFVAGLAAVVLWLAVRARREGFRAADALALLVPAAAVVGAVYGFFLTRVSLHTLVYVNLYPVRELRAAADVALRAHAPLTVHSFIVIAGRLVLYAAGCAVLVLAGRVLGRTRRITLAWGVCAFALLVVVAASFADPEALRTGLKFVYGWIPVGAWIATAWLAVAIWRRRRAWDTRTQSLLLVFGCLAVYSVTVYGSFFMFAPHPQMAVWVMPFVALLLVELHVGLLGSSRRAWILGAAWLVFVVGAGIGLTLKDASAKSALVRGTGGVIAESPPVAAVYNEAIKRIDMLTKPGEPILVAPVNTDLYILANRPSALNRISLLPGALPAAADQRAVIAQLERKHVRLAVTDRREFVEYGQGHFGGSFDRLLAAWLHRNFVHVTTLQAPHAPTLDVWLRRNNQ